MAARLTKVDVKILTYLQKNRGWRNAGQISRALDLKENIVNLSIKRLLAHNLIENIFTEYKAY